MEFHSPFNIIKVIFQRHYRGYYYRRELINDSDFGGDGNLEMVNCYSENGDYIGDAKSARYLCKKIGITHFEKINKDACICSIGFNPIERKWYGWSHRAIYGFGIGSEVKKGHCGYTATDRNDFLEDMIRFWNDDCHDHVIGEFAEEGNLNGVRISWTINDKARNKKLHGQINSVFQPFPDKWGRGEWIARTLNDAKQMAINFSNGIS